jgi:hypothetical protein
LTNILEEDSSSSSSSSFFFFFLLKIEQKKEKSQDFRKMHFQMANFDSKSEGKKEAALSSNQLMAIEKISLLLLDGMEFLLFWSMDLLKKDSFSQK